MFASRSRRCRPHASACLLSSTSSEARHMVRNTKVPDNNSTTNNANPFLLFIDGE